MHIFLVLELKVYFTLLYLISGACNYIQYLLFSNTSRSKVPYLGQMMTTEQIPTDWRSQKVVESLEKID